MAESRRRRRRRRIVMALAVGSGVWFVRSRLGGREASDPWPVRPQLPAPPVERDPAAPAVEAPAPAREQIVAEPVAAVTDDGSADAKRSAGANRSVSGNGNGSVSGNGNGSVSGNGNGNGNGNGAHRAAVDDAVEAPYGPGSARSLPDGSAPGPEYTIKGNTASKLFHPPTSPYFARTKAQVWFRTAEDATAAGFTAWTPKKRAAKA